MRREWRLHLLGWRGWRHWRRSGRQRRRRMHRLSRAVVSGGLFLLHYRLLVLRADSMNKANMFLISSALAIVFLPVLGVADCSSSSSCIDCIQNQRQIASCTTVTYSASCSCSLDVGTPEFCILDGACSYTGGSGGTGGPGGTGGGGGATCYTSGGQWCPPQCSSCTHVFWN